MTRTKTFISTVVLSFCHQVTAQEDLEIPLQLSCSGETTQHLFESEGGPRNMGVREYIVYIDPDKKRLAFIDEPFQWIGTEELEVGINEYSYQESNYEISEERVRIAINRTTLDFRAGFRDVLGVFYNVEGSCIKLNPQI